MSSLNLVVYHCSRVIQRLQGETCWNVWYLLTPYSLNHLDQTLLSVCSFRFLQAGSFPIAAPLNETFPKDFNLRTTESYHLKTKVKHENVSLSFSLESPMPGNWYSIAYLTGKIDEQILIKVKKSYTKAIVLKTYCNKLYENQSLFVESGWIVWL